jgi:hypothetical protein
VIRDIQALRETGQVCRHVAELDISPAAWRAAIRETARMEGIRIRTFLIPSLDPAPVRSEPSGAGADDVFGAMVCAVRTDVAPNAPEGRTDPLSWRRVDDLPVTVGTWRSMVRRTARRDRIAIRTFLIPPSCDQADDLTGQVVYAVWTIRPRSLPAAAPACPPNGRVG